MQMSARSKEHHQSSGGSCHQCVRALGGINWQTSSYLASACCGRPPAVKPWCPSTRALHLPWRASLLPQPHVLRLGVHRRWQCRCGAATEFHGHHRRQRWRNTTGPGARVLTRAGVPSGLEAPAATAREPTAADAPQALPNTALRCVPPHRIDVPAEPPLRVLSSLRCQRAAPAPSPRLMRREAPGPLSGVLIAYVVVVV